ncbi:MAG: hypothetical protein U9Q40_01805 [Campylobacterota bacterium]|nr:hypothetical protein [Campylobacterota bacterium]
MPIDIITILVMTLPMLLFSVYPGIKLSDYLEEKYDIGESTKRKVAVTTTILFTLTLSSLLYYI